MFFISGYARTHKLLLIAKSHIVPLVVAAVASHLPVALVAAEARGPSC